jgi:hypothetical protein
MKERERKVDIVWENKMKRLGKQNGKYEDISNKQKNKKCSLCGTCV